MPAGPVGMALGAPEHRVRDIPQAHFAAVIVGPELVWNMYSA